MLKKMLLLASMALAVAAFTAPSAQAFWTHEGEPIETDQTLTATGEAEFKVGFGTPFEFGVHWTTHMTITMEAGTTTATVTDSTVTHCTGTGALSGLRCTATAQAGPWAAHVEEDDTVSITDIEVHVLFYSGSDPDHLIPVATSLLHGDIKATLDTPAAITTLTLSNISLTMGGNPIEIEGDLHTDKPGTYGVN